MLELGMAQDATIYGGSLMTNNMLDQLHIPAYGDVDVPSRSAPAG